MLNRIRERLERIKWFLGSNDERIIKVYNYMMEISKNKIRKILY